jgi:hypothetical protein
VRAHRDLAAACVPCLDDEWAKIVARCAEAKTEACERLSQVESAYRRLREAQEVWIQSLRGQIAKLDMQIATPR